MAEAAMDDLGQQERVILELLTANPFIGQAEMARTLGVARSTVAAHIVSLVRKGHVLGRGYMLPQPQRIVCIGAAAIDRKYHLHARLVTGTSNPANGARSFGGVARNVVENLARLGATTSLITLVGDDENGREILRQLRDLGVDVSKVVSQSGLTTAEYVAVLDPSNDLALGIADMNIFDHFSAAHLDRVWPHLASARWVFADCNLPANILSLLVARARDASFSLAIDTVSAPKAARLPRDLTGIDILFINRDEAAVLLQRGATPDDPPAMARALLRLGVRRVVMTMGAAGCIIAENDAVVRIPSVKARPVDVTGAGDALIAGTLYRHVKGESLASSVQTGTLLATLTTESEATVLPDLSEDVLEAARSRLSRSAK